VILQQVYDGELDGLWNEPWMDINRPQGLVEPAQVLRSPKDTKQAKRGSSSVHNFVPRRLIASGDSFLGALVWALSSGRRLEDALRYGIAAGSLALLTPGTGLCRREDVECFVGQVDLEVI
jgi:hypothetical protein